MIRAGNKCTLSYSTAYHLLFSVILLDAAYARKSIGANEWNLSHGFCSSRPPDYYCARERAFHFEYWLLEAQRAHCQVHCIARPKCRKEAIHVHNQLIKLPHVYLLLGALPLAISRRYFAVHIKIS